MIPRPGRLHRAGAAGLLGCVLLALAGCQPQPAGRDRADVAALSPPGRLAFALADSLAEAGRLGQARERIEAHAGWVEAHAASVDERAETRLRLGRLLVQLGDAEGALPHLARAIQLAHDAEPPRRSLEVRALNAWGGAAKNLGRYDEARRSHESAATLARAMGEAGLRDLALARYGVGMVLRRDPALRDSTALFLAEAVDLMQRAAGDSSLDVANMRLNHGLVLAQLDRLEEARAQVEAARALQARHYAPDDPRLAYASGLAGWLGFRIGRHAAARSALEHALESYTLMRHETPVGRARQRYRPKAADHLAAVHLATGEPERAWDALDAAQSLLVRETITRRARDPVLDAGSRSATTPPHARAAVQAVLDPGTAILGWLDVNLVEEQPVESWVYVLRHRGPVRWFRLGTDAADSLRNGARFWEYLDRLGIDAAWPTRVATTPEFVAAAQAAWRERFAPAEPALVGVDRLVVVLSEWMARVPVDALVDESGAPLLDRFAVSYVHSPSALVDMVRPGPARGGPVLLIDGDLFAGERSERGRVGAHARFASTTRLRAGRGAEAAMRATWGQTAGAPGLVQFDGHTITDPRLPGGSALVLDGAGSGWRALQAPPQRHETFADRPDDGLLSVAEIEQLRLPADLVVLAACTSAGQYGYGGFNGLGDAFLRAGARCVLTSLWPVDERATGELLRRFYAHAYETDGTPRPPLAVALQRAKQETRAYQAPDGSRPFEHPAYWAAFELVGDPGSGHEHEAAR